MIRPRNPNCGVATVASVTLQKLVVPLQALNIDERELNLLKEIVLFNPGLYCCIRHQLIMIFIIILFYLVHCVILPAPNTGVCCSIVGHSIMHSLI